MDYYFKVNLLWQIILPRHLQFLSLQGMQSPNHNNLHVFVFKGIRGGFDFMMFKAIRGVVPTLKH